MKLGALVGVGVILTAIYLRAKHWMLNVLFKVVNTSI
jgi:hypothetical protein